MTPLNSATDLVSKRIRGKKVVILGFGREGQSTYKFLREHFPKLSIVILDSNAQCIDMLARLSTEDQLITFACGETYLDSVNGDSFIFKSPGIPAYLNRLDSAVKMGAILSSQTEIFISCFANRVIGVTGTKGKSTASNAIFHVLSSSNNPVVFLGNIGVPAFDSLAELKSETIVVYEISSHQSEGLTVGPHIGVLLSLFPEHLDYYKTLEAYKKAKQRLFLLQADNDICIYRCDDKVVTSMIRPTHSIKIGFSKQKETDSTIYLNDNNEVVMNGKLIINAENLLLKGVHNILNIMPSIYIGSLYGMSSAQIASALRTLKPLTGRLERIATQKDIHFYDDALATIPEATIEALRTLDSSVKTLIAGGFDRGREYKGLAKYIARSGVETLILFPTTGKRIEEEIVQVRPDIHIHHVNTMKDAVTIAYQSTPKDGIVLLSSASPSFGIFRDYADRSNQYIHWIHELK